jgi:nucleotide-binding universal stress UspA family protein
VRIVVGFLRSPEGRAALDRAVEEARLRDAELLVIHSLRGQLGFFSDYIQAVPYIGYRFKG